MSGDFLYKRAYCRRFAFWITSPGDSPAKAASTPKCIYFPPSPRAAAWGNGFGCDLFLFLDDVVLGIAGCSVVTFWHWDSVLLLGFSSSQSIWTLFCGRDSSVWDAEMLPCIASANEGSLGADHSSITSEESHLHFFYWGKSILIN